MERKLPPADVLDLFPPVADSPGFRYFEHAERHPFAAGAEGFSPVNAWWLAEASLLAYSPAPEAVAAFARAGWTVARGGPIAGGHSHCYVAHDDRIVVVAFRGTEALRPDLWGSLSEAWRNALEVAGDVRTDAQFELVELSPGSDRYVHRGFLAGLDALWSEVEDELSRLAGAEGTQRTVWLTGHSLGAALATLAADRFPAVRGLYTYGSPRVGDARFTLSFRAPAFRLVNADDLVARAPRRGPYAPPKTGMGRYEHVGRLHALDTLGDLSGIAARAPEAHRALAALRASIAALPPGWAPDEPTDHAPLLYALGTWNALAGAGDGEPRVDPGRAADLA